MTPEARVFIVGADDALTDAKIICSARVWPQASRLGYYAKVSAAQALIFERMTKVVKTHKGVASAFHGLALAEPGLPPGLAAQLSRDYRFKAAADNDTPAGFVITEAEDTDAIATAETFVALVCAALEASPAPPSP